MCMDGVCLHVMENEALQERLADPSLDLVHRQVVMTLYSMHAANQLEQGADMLPVYLGVDRQECERILSDLERVGVIDRSEGGLSLTYPVEMPHDPCACTC